MQKFKIKRISKSYSNGKGVNALENISINVENKEFISIVGPSGCGKTTLLRIIAGLLDSSSGQIFIDEKPLEKFDKKVGMMFQAPVNFPWLTVRENIEFGMKLKKLPETQIEEISKKLIKAVGLQGHENSSIDTLSGGMAQRVTIATVLANDPELILMDEPFSALDAQTKELMQELLSSIWQQDKKIVLFVTHDIDEAIFLSDKVIVFAKNPGTIKKVVEIKLPRPRIHDIKFSKEFLEIKKHITNLIREEVLRS